MDNLPKHLLYPADIFVQKNPYLVSTVLGSCVAVCLYSPTIKVGAINHYILPQWNGSDLVTIKYGNLSIIRIIEGMLNFGCDYSDIEARVYGGAEVLTGVSTRFNIGRRNIAIAVEMLTAFRIPIVSSETGGDMGRKIVFNTYTGEVECFMIKKREYLDETKKQIIVV
ncbi:MAG: chemotaxis protein CheD [Bacteroidales bacterium]|nr:chemotaxis protein CheD [Bacteroidales bacterium]